MYHIYYTKVKFQNNKSTRIHEKLHKIYSCGKCLSYDTTARSHLG